MALLGRIGGERCRQLGFGRANCGIEGSDQLECQPGRALGPCDFPNRATIVVLGDKLDHDEMAADEDLAPEPAGSPRIC